MEMKPDEVDFFSQLIMIIIIKKVGGGAYRSVNYIAAQQLAEISLRQSDIERGGLNPRPPRLHLSLILTKFIHHGIVFECSCITNGLLASSNVAQEASHDFS